MKNFKSKNIPNFTIRIDKMQEAYCNSTINLDQKRLLCKLTDCDECLFSPQNLSIFQEWFSITREKKLERILK